MSFLHPAALIIGAGLATLPVLVHVLTKPRPERFLFSAMRFLESALRQRRFFARLRDVLLLALRTLLVAAMAVAFARPLFEGAMKGPVEDVRSRIVILDVSRSMGARKGGVRVFDRARAHVMRHLLREGGARANLIFAGARSQAVFDRFSTNYPALAAELRRTEVTDEELNARAALAQAAQLFARAQEQEAGRGQLVIVTDLQETNWRKVAGGMLPSDVDVVVEYVGLGADADNLAIKNVSVEGWPRAGRPADVRVEVGNFSGSAQVRTVRLLANDRVYRQKVECGAWQTAATVFQLSDEMTGSADAEGWITGAARIAEARDALPADDVRHFAFELKKSPTFVLMTREDPRAAGTASYFLSRMLCPDPADDARGGEKVLVVPPGSVGGRTLRDADMLVVNRPGRMSESTVEQMVGMLLRGFPVLYFACEPVDAENIAALDRACGDALALPVKFVGWQGGARGSVGDAGFRAGAPVGVKLARLDEARSPFMGFGDHLERLSQELEAFGILKTTPAPDGAAEDTLAAWSDGSAAMIDARAGSGHLAVWNGRLIASSLHRSPFFVALVRQWATTLLLKRLAVAGALPVGAARMLPLPALDETAGALELVDSEGRRIEEFEPVREGEGLTWRWAAVAPPGVYRVRCDGKTLLAVATTCDAAESDLRPIAAAALEARLADGRSQDGASSVAVRGTADRPGSEEKAEIWPWLLVAGLVFILLELGLLKLFRT